MAISSRTQQQAKKTPDMGIVIDTADLGAGAFIPIHGSVEDAFAAADYVKADELPLRVRGWSVASTIVQPNAMRNMNGEFPFATAEAAFTVVSANAADTIAGTGAQKVTVVYLDDALAIQKEELDMDGITPVGSVATDYKHPMYAYVSQVGSNNRTVGDISIKKGAPTFDLITAEQNTSSQARITVPAGYRLRITGYTYGAGALAGTIISLRSNLNPYTQLLNSDPELFHEVNMDMVLASPLDSKNSPRMFPAGVTIWMEFLPLSAGPFVSGGFDCQWVKGT